MEGKPGILSFLELKQDEIELLISNMDKTELKNNMQVLIEVIGEEELLKFLDIFAGCTFKVPRRKNILDKIMNVKIYSYCKNKSRTEETYKAAARIFGKRVSTIRNVVTELDELTREGRDEDVEKYESGAYKGQA